MIKADDLEYRDLAVTSVERRDDGGWLIGTDDGWSFFCPDAGVVPRVGSAARFYGRGIGYTVRGLDIDGREVFYRTPEQDAARHREWVAENQAKRRREFEANREKLDADYASLSPEFRTRLDGFRRRRADWRWEFEPYEMSVCVDAVRIARALGSADAVTHFHGLPWAEQQTLVPGLFQGHSGNSFGMACHLARISLDRPDLIERAHGALCPLVGCEEYGCVAAEPTP